MNLPGLGVAEAVALATLASIAVGIACGFVNGFISAYWGLPSFIVTLGMLNIARGAALQVTDARAIYSFHQRSTRSARRHCSGYHSPFLSL